MTKDEPTDRTHCYADELLDCLPKSADFFRSQFGELNDGLYANLEFADGHLHPETADALHDAGWRITDAYRYGESAIVVRVEYHFADGEVPE